MGKISRYFSTFLTIIIIYHLAQRGTPTKFLLLLNRGEIYHMALEAEMRTLLCTLCPLYRPEQGNIVGREYIKVCEFLKIKNCKSRIAKQELQIINCKSRIANQELQVKNCKSRVAGQELQVKNCRSIIACNTLEELQVKNCKSRIASQ
jgi:hypothetical protein